MKELFMLFDNIRKLIKSVKVFVIKLKENMKILKCKRIEQIL